MISQASDFCRIAGIISDNGPTFAVRTEIFAGIEAEASQVAEAADPPPLVLRTVRLSTRPQSRQAVPSSDVENRIHIGAACHTDGPA